MIHYKSLTSEEVSFFFFKKTASKSMQIRNSTADFLTFTIDTHQEGLEYLFLLLKKWYKKLIFEKKTVY
ncbi:MAG: hypothetical protein LBD11_07535 [Candidatus Peribacteria bacterium]|nr:hypothetical protein [Candidatus Peribacteria bacterium]